MNNQINFTPARDTLKTILGNGKYYFVPKFQRNYSWEKEQWEDLWLDIMDLWSDKDQHYMGNMVLRSVTNEQFEIIDGQQRITTLSLLIQAIVEYLRKNNLPILADNINKEFLVRRIPGNAEYNAVKLNLNETNNNFYIRLNTSKDIISERAENESNRLMFKAYKYFYDKLSNEFNGKNPAEIDTFLNYFASNLIFIHITSDTDEKVYSIFETLNSRGLSLTATDLIKNYILGIINDEQTKSFWDNIAIILDNQLFDFIRHYMTITIGGGKIIREKNTFKVFKNNYKTPKDILNFLIDTNKYISFYNALSSSTNEFWLDFNNDKEIAKNIEELKMFKATQYKSLILSVFINLPTLFPQVLKVIKNLTFRYSTICSQNPNDLETVYSEIAFLVNKKEITELSKIKEGLKKVYISDSEFKESFRNKLLNYKDNRSRKIISYILWQLECQVSNNGSDYNLQDINSTIEHILPENASEEWNFIKSESDQFKNRIGNFTLLEADINRKIGNFNFQKKVKFYKESNYKTTNDLSKYPSWTPQSIVANQEKMSNIATSVWSVSFLSIKF